MRQIAPASGYGKFCSIYLQIAITRDHVLMVVNRTDSEGGQRDALPGTCDIFCADDPPPEKPPDVERQSWDDEHWGSSIATYMCHPSKTYQTSTST